MFFLNFYLKKIKFTKACDINFKIWIYTMLLQTDLNLTDSALENNALDINNIQLQMKSI